MKTLGNIKPPPFTVITGCVDDRWWTEERNMSLGEVYNHNMSEEESKDCLKSFFSLLGEQGYKPRHCERYSSLSLTSCRGSVGSHDDQGYGLVALWLVRLSGLIKGRYAQCGDSPELFAGKKWRTVRPGDVVVFNSDNEHAWLANGTCHMVMQTVAKKRNRY